MCRRHKRYEMPSAVSYVVTVYKESLAGHWCLHMTLAVRAKSFLSGTDWNVGSRLEHVVEAFQSLAEFELNKRIHLPGTIAMPKACRFMFES